MACSWDHNPLAGPLGPSGYPNLPSSYLPPDRPTFAALRGAACKVSVKTQHLMPRLRPSGTVSPWTILLLAPHIHKNYTVYIYMHQGSHTHNAVFDVKMTYLRAGLTDPFGFAMRTLALVVLIRCVCFRLHGKEVQTHRPVLVGLLVLVVGLKLEMHMSPPVGRAELNFLDLGGLISNGL